MFANINIIYINHCMIFFSKNIWQVYLVFIKKIKLILSSKINRLGKEILNFRYTFGFIFSEV